MAVPECNSAPTFPTWAESSPRYQSLFNATAKNMKIPLEYTGDRQLAPGCRPNVPEVECVELDVLHSDPKYRVSGGGVNRSLIARDVCAVRTEIERRRVVMNKASVEVYPVSKSTTLTGGKKRMLNAAERAWAGQVAPIFYDVSLALYGLQATRQSTETTAWMRANADPVS